jgi:chromosome partitioning protein
MRTIAVVNQKGGCGKTITAINLSAFLAQAARRVLLVDIDPQGHASLGVQREVAPATKTISDLLRRELWSEEIMVHEVARKVRENLDLVPADILLSAVPEQLAAVTGRENKLAEALAEVRGQYHYAIIDCPPHVGLLTFNALMACSEVIIPIEPSFFSLHGIGMLLETINALKRRTKHEIEIHALITLYAGRTEFAREVVQDIRKHLGNRVFETVIRFSIKLAEAASHGMPVTEYCKTCAGYKDYQSLAREVIAEEATRPIQEILQPGFPEVSIQEKDMLEGMRLPAAPTPTPKGVVFTLAAPWAHHVQVAGDFNSWVPERAELQFLNGIWQTVIPLAPGRYRYRYIVDGSWQSDPSNALAEPTPYGGNNSVFIVGEPDR